MMTTTTMINSSGSPQSCHLGGGGSAIRGSVRVWHWYVGLGANLVVFGSKRGNQYRPSNLNE